LLTGCALGQSKPEASGSIQGAVFMSEQDHARSVVPGTKLSLDGALHLEAESDSEGKFVFSAVPAGSYTITAQAPGLTATQNIEIRAGSDSRLELEMTVQAVTESATVTASADPVDTKEPSGINTVGESAVGIAPFTNKSLRSGALAAPPSNGARPKIFCNVRKVALCA